MTKQLAHKLHADYIQFYITTPYPGTPMYLDIIKKDPKLKEIPYDKYCHGGIDLSSFVEIEIPEKHLLELQQSLNNEFLKKTGLQMLKNKWLIWDMFTLSVQKPKIIADAFSALIKTGKITEFYRVFYYNQNFRRV